MDGLWDSAKDPSSADNKVTLSRTIWWKADQDWRANQDREYGHLGQTGFGVKPNSHQKVIITVLDKTEDRSKFKIIAVTTC